MSERPPVELHTRPNVGAVLSVRVPGDLAGEIDEDATAAGLSLSEYVRAVLERRNTLTGGSLAVTLASPAVPPDGDRPPLPAETIAYDKGVMDGYLAAKKDYSPGGMYASPAVPPEGLDVETALVRLARFTEESMSAKGGTGFLSFNDLRYADSVAGRSQPGEFGDESDPWPEDTARRLAALRVARLSDTGDTA